MAELADVLAFPTLSAPAAARPAARSLGRTVTRTQQRVNDTIGAAVSSINDAATDGVRAATRRLTEEPSGATDDWGRDPVLVRNMMLLAQLRWDVSTGGDQHLPKRGGALIVVNAPRFASSSVFTAFAISEAVDRPVRFVGRRTTPLVSSLDQRIGALLDHPDEIAGALRAGELVVLGAGTTTGLRNVGSVDHAIIGAALATKTRVFPAATTSSPFARRARVEVGPASRPPRRRRGPLTELELADKIRGDVRKLLDEMGDINTGTPLDWLPLSGIGAH
ncbi:MAG: hypothetical protein ACJAXA_003112 [Candidatus Aldehydirespiratoraceae bacterium]|jgi:hypothetical protein